MTPAQKLAAKVKAERKPRNRRPPRQRAWRCLIRQYREELELSLDHVAKAVGLSKTALWHLENGTDPMLTTARRVADFFGVDVWGLWRPKTEPK